MSKITFTEYALDIEIKNLVAEGQRSLTFQAEYEVMDVPPDFSADNDVDFYGYREILSEEYYHDGNTFEVVAEYVSGYLRMEVPQIIELLQQAVARDADI